MTKARLALWLPLAMFILFAGVVAFGLRRPPSTVIESKLVGQPVPAFALPGFNAAHPGLDAADLRQGRPILLNIFASWCVPCAAEAPQLMALKRAGVTIHAVAVRDRPEDISRFLKHYGDPYTHIGLDDRSQVQMAIGSSGVPESFIIDGRGIIRHQHIGDIRPENVPELLKRLELAR